jgi:phosphoribosyl-ATP pyrophosphohydrolase
LAASASRWRILRQSHGVKHEVEPSWQVGPSGLARTSTASSSQSSTTSTTRRVGEEAVELAVAALAEDDERVVSEAADLWFHVLVLLRSRGLDPAALEDELRRRDR